MFRAYITNLGKYNEGALVGEWVDFPTTAKEMNEVMRRIEIGSTDEFGCPYEEFFITDYDIDIDGITRVLGEYENLELLNYLAARLEEMDKWDREKFEAALSICDEANDAQGLINLTYNLDSYIFYEGINSDYDIGYQYIEEGGYDTGTMGILQNYIDYEAFGRDCRLEEKSAFVNGGYICHDGSSFDEYFNGELDDIPDEYRLYDREEDAA